MGGFDWPLLMALIKRWMPETSIFYLRIGKMIVKLQDMATILGLRIDGSSLTGTNDKDWVVKCERLLGMRPFRRLCGVEH